MFISCLFALSPLFTDCKPPKIPTNIKMVYQFEKNWQIKDSQWTGDKLLVALRYEPYTIAELRQFLENPRSSNYEVKSAFAIVDLTSTKLEKFLPLENYIIFSFYKLENSDILIVLNMKKKAGYEITQISLSNHNVVTLLTSADLVKLGIEMPMRLIPAGEGSLYLLDTLDKPNNKTELKFPLSTESDLMLIDYKQKKVKWRYHLPVPILDFTINEKTSEIYASGGKGDIFIIDVKQPRLRRKIHTSIYERFNFAIQNIEDVAGGFTSYSPVHEKLYLAASYVILKIDVKRGRVTDIFWTAPLGIASIGRVFSKNDYDFYTGLNFFPISVIYTFQLP